MNYLQLVQELAREAGTEAPSEITDLAALETQHQKDLKSWIDRAYREIQLMRDGWEFRRGTLTIPLVSGTRSYDISATASDFENIYPFVEPYDRKYAIIDNQRYNPVYFIDWEEWRGWVEAQQDHDGRPRFFTVDPSDNLIVYPKPRKSHSFVCDYVKAVDELSGNTDEPVIPARFHDAIIFFALVEYAGYDEAASQYQRADRQYRRILRRLMNDQLTGVRLCP